VSCGGEWAALTSNSLATAVLESFDESALQALAIRLKPYLPREEPDGWLDAAGAAAYLSLPKSTLHKLTAERAIPFAQDGPGCKVYFKRSDLDAWREC
jgi:excisionase family DNA binding protein